MKALVTGATGFLGSRLVRRLVERGDSVAVLVRASSNLQELDPVRAALRVHLVDDRPETVDAAVARELPDVVFHLATFYRRDHNAGDLAPLLEANVAFPLRLVDAMARHGVSRLVNTGSAWQYFERDVYRPVCLHSASKQAFETFLAYFVDTGAIDCVTLVMHDTYGPGDPRRKIFSILRDHAGRSEPLAMSGGEQVVDFIHVRDAVAAYITAAERLCGSRNGTAHETYSVSGGTPAPLRRVIEMYVRQAGWDIPIEWGARPYHAREVMVPWRGGALLPGWQPRVDIESGLRELAAEQNRTREAGLRA